MTALKSVLSSGLLVLQLCLGFWQIAKLTPVGGLIQAVIAWLLSLLPFFLSSTHAQLNTFPGHVFKKARLNVMKAGNLFRFNEDTSQNETALSYLGDVFRLERKRSVDENTLYVNESRCPCYHITNSHWYFLVLVANEMKNEEMVILKGYKSFWEGVATGGVMDFFEVLDCVILENQEIFSVTDGVLLPVNLSNFKPSNDIEWKVIKGNHVRAVIAGGAKTDKMGATLVRFDRNILELEHVEGKIRKTIKCGDIDIEFCWFRQECDARPTTSGGGLKFHCSEEEFIKVITLFSCMGKNRSGSLKSCSPKNKVRVRGLWGSLDHYINTGYPRIYELDLGDAVVE
ncbi:hypothetical protein KI387_028295 [Taxus chinensis]|uniref:Uncharacterized protein n=1 Tax=Taxus chinensis TaxID=29808 RepID=A0AA38G0G7_TAXCH|nr:hypothetical protein KI387_028295 [Taxus chinensis]